jgi:hypothetical protein
MSRLRLPSSFDEPAQREPLRPLPTLPLPLPTLQLPLPTPLRLLPARLRLPQARLRLPPPPLLLPPAPPRSRIPFCSAARTAEPSGGPYLQPKRSRQCLRAA